MAAIAPVVVLIIDCENGQALSRRRYRPLVAQARRSGHPVGKENLWIELRSRGLDLTVSADVSWLLKRIRAVKPDLLVIGPLYRLHAANPNEEEPARKVVSALDLARTKANCALLVETHSPHADGMSRVRPVRPIGSSLYMRWPEFGYGLRYADEPEAHEMRVMDLVAWRGPRDERGWPRRLIQGADWPWKVHASQ